MILQKKEQSGYRQKDFGTVQQIVASGHSITLYIAIRTEDLLSSVLKAVPKLPSVPEKREDRHMVIGFSWKG